MAVRSCVLILANLLIPFGWERTAGCETGFACLFTEEFSTPPQRTASVGQLLLFQAAGTPVFFPPPAALARLKQLFEQMLTELPSPYPHKYEVLRNYVHLLLHEAQKLLPATQGSVGATAQFQG